MLMFPTHFGYYVFSIVYLSLFQQRLITFSGKSGGGVNLIEFHI